MSKTHKIAEYVKDLETVTKSVFEKWQKMLEGKTVRIIKGRTETEEVTDEIIKVKNVLRVECYDGTHGLSVFSTDDGNRSIDLFQFEIM